MRVLVLWLLGRPGDGHDPSTCLIVGAMMVSRSGAKQTKALNPCLFLKYFDVVSCSSVPKMTLKLGTSVLQGLTFVRRL